VARTTQRADAADPRAHGPGLEREGRRALVDRRAVTLGGFREPPRELGWLHARAMRREARAAQACDPDARRRFLGLQHVAAPAGPHALELRRRLGHGERAALDGVAVDRLAGAGGADLVDGLVGGALQRGDSRLAGRRPQPRAGRDVAEHPAAVAPRGPEPGHRALEHDDLQRGVGPPQLVGGPQPRVAGADDAHVGLAVAAQRRARSREAAEVRPPPGRRVGHRAHPDILLTRAGLQ
jgi:hypothetical protein